MAFGYRYHGAMRIRGDWGVGDPVEHKRWMIF